MKTSEFKKIMVNSIELTINRLQTEKSFKRFFRIIFIIGWTLLLALVWLTVHLYEIESIGFYYLAIYWLISILLTLIQYQIVGWGRMFRYYKEIWS